MLEKLLEAGVAKYEADSTAGVWFLLAIGLRGSELVVDGWPGIPGVRRRYSPYTVERMCEELLQSVKSPRSYIGAGHAEGVPE
jgi:hypothetical protein